MTVSIHPKGTTFVRSAMALAISKGNRFGAADFAAERWGEDAPAARVLKAAIAAGTTGGTTWAGPLVGEAASAAAEFVSLVRAQSIIGRLTGLRRMPTRTPVLLQTGAASSAWVAEGNPMPVTNMSFDRRTFETLKVAALCVVTNELLASADPAAEAIIRADLVRAVVEASDLAFIDPANAGVADEKPASVTHGVTALAASGDIAFDLKRLVASFAGDLQAAYFVGSPALYAQLAGVDFPNIGARGGEILGIPALASSNVPDAVGSYQLALLDPTGIAFMADDAQAEVKSSEEGVLQLRDDPVTSATNHVSMFQVNSTAIAALIRENWEAVRPGSVALLTGIAKLEV